MNVPTHEPNCDTIQPLGPGVALARAATGELLLGLAFRVDRRGPAGYHPARHPVRWDTIDGWVRSRGFDRASLIERVKAGYPAEVLTYPPKTPGGCGQMAAWEVRHHGATVDGVHGSAAHWAAVCGLSVAALLSRILYTRNMTLAQALTTPTNRPRVPSTAKKAVERPYKATERPFEYEGVYGTLQEHCERLGLPYARVRGRTYAKRLNGKVYPALTREQALDAGLRRPRCDIGGTHAKRPRAV